MTQPSMASTIASPHQQIKNLERFCAERLQDSDLASSFHHRCVHGKEDNQEADQDGHYGHNADEDFELGNIVDVELRDKILNGNSLQITLKFIVQFIDGGNGFVGIFELYQNLRNLAGIARSDTAAWLKGL